jgi:hypothetical protein
MFDDPTMWQAPLAIIMMMLIVGAAFAAVAYITKRWDSWTTPEFPLENPGINIESIPESPLFPESMSEADPTFRRFVEEQALRMTLKDARVLAVLEEYTVRIKEIYL